MNLKKFLFICEGNVGRSQMAEGFYNFYSGRTLATSAGVQNIGAKYNWTPREDIIEAMKEVEIDISKHKIKQIHPSHLNEINKIYILCAPHYIPEFVINSGIEIIYYEIQDPYLMSFSGVRVIRDQIKKLVKDLLEAANN